MATRRTGRHAQPSGLECRTGGPSKPAVRARRVALHVASEAAARARRIVEELAGDHSRRYDILLATSELVTNVVRHAPTTRFVELVVRRDDRVVHVSVHQAESFTSRTPSRTGADGYGLEIVAAVADRWGIEREDTVAVWFEISG